MTKGYERPQDIKDDGCVDHTVHEQLAKVFDGGNSALVELENVLLRPLVSTIEETTR